MKKQIPRNSRQARAYKAGLRLGIYRPRSLGAAPGTKSSGPKLRGSSGFVQG